MRARHQRPLRFAAATAVAAIALAGCISGGGSAATATAPPAPTRATPSEPAPTGATPTVAAPTQQPTVPPAPVTAPPETRVPDGLQASDWIGVWRGQEVNEFGVADAETAFMANGTFTNLTTNLEFGSMVRSWGTWRIVQGAVAFLRFDIDGHEPTEFCGPVTCTPVLMPAGVSQSFAFLDRNTVVLWASDCASAACRVTYTRVA